MKKAVWFLWIMLMGTVYGQLKELSYYEVKPVSVPPVINGKLDDPCWREANRHTVYYEYFKPNPGPGALKTEFRMLYDAKGVYLGVINYEKEISGIRKNITDRDNLELWKDDCAEIYFDHYADGIGFRKFMVNSIGTVADMMRIDTAVSMPEWNGTGWLACASINEDSWSFEAFFPWEDLGEQAQPGDLWMFCHVRYSFVGGGFQGVTSSPGGNYTATDCFGYIYFTASGELSSSERIATLLEKKIKPPWSLQLGRKMIFDTGSGVQSALLSELASRECHQVEKLLVEIERSLGNRYQENHGKVLTRLKSDYQELDKLETADKMNVRFRTATLLHNKLDVLKWQVELEKDFN